MICATLSNSDCPRGFPRTCCEAQSGTAPTGDKIAQWCRSPVQILLDPTPAFATDVESPFVTLNFKSRLGNDGGQEGEIKHGNGGPQEPRRHRPRVLGNTEEGPRAGCPSPPRMVGSKGLLQRPL